MAEECIIGEFYCCGLTDCRTEYLCMQREPDGTVTLTRKSRILLGSEGWFDGDVVWPEGCRK